MSRRRLGFGPWVGKFPWRRAWLPIPVFLPGESHGHRNLAGYSPWGCKSQTRLKWLSMHAVYICQSQSPNSSHLPFPLGMYTFVLYFCFVNKKVYNNFFEVPTHKYMVFWPTSLWITVSRSIHAKTIFGKHLKCCLSSGNWQTLYSTMGDCVGGEAVAQFTGTGLNPVSVHYQQGDRG